MSTRTYRYYAIMRNENGQEIVWFGRVGNNQSFIIDTISKLGNEWHFVKANRCEAETKREKQYYSMACIDMGQAERS